jgi:hypothetical protein
MKELSHNSYVHTMRPIIERLLSNRRLSNKFRYIKIACVCQLETEPGARSKVSH